MNLPVWPNFSEAERKAVGRVLESGRVNQWTGDESTLFEKEIAPLFENSKAVALANGTLALELALRALGVHEGDEVVVPSHTFIATASAAVVLGARPICADIDPVSGNITKDTIEAALTPKTRAIVPVHVLGWPCEMPEIMELAKEHDLKVVEDCAQAHGATINGNSVGSFGHAAAFSFCQDKIMTTGGEGGMVVTNDGDIWRRVWEFKDHGKSYDAVFNQDHPPGFRWVHESFGSNYRMTEMQAAIGRVQLRKLPQWVQIRRENAQILKARFQDVPGLRVPEPPPRLGHAYYKFYAHIEPAQLKAGWTRDRVLEAIQAKGVPCSTGICPEIYQEKAFQDRGFGPAERLPNAKRFGETSLMFLVHPTLEKEHMHRMANRVEQVMRGATRA